MKGIVRKTWDIVDVVGKPTGERDEYVLVDQDGSGQEYAVEDVITEGSLHTDFCDCYAAMNRNGSVSIFKDEPKKIKWLGKWIGDRIVTIPCKHIYENSGYIFSWDNVKPVKCTLDIMFKTDIYKSHKKQ